MKSGFIKVFLIFILLACNDKVKRRILVDDVYAEGNISKDTIYNGRIKFYDTATNKIIIVANYKAGNLNGKRTDYYANGEIRKELYYENGKLNGVQTIFDSLGNISVSQNFYYDLRVGPSISFNKGEPSQYYFYSLENKELLHIDYDSMQEKRLEQLNDNKFFFWHLNDFKISGPENQITELFLYLPNPPKLNFKYSLCVIDSAYTVIETIKEFNNINNWVVINLNYQSLKKNNQYAIKLTIDNMFDGDDRISNMFKKL